MDSGQEETLVPFENEYPEAAKVLSDLFASGYRVGYHAGIDVERNWPCPCRSGKKFKQCCQKKTKPSSSSITLTTSTPRRKYSARGIATVNSIVNAWIYRPAPR